MRRVFLLAFAVLSVACSRPAPPPEPPRLVRTQTVAAAQADEAVEFAGEVRARVESRLGFRVGGKIIERLVDVGARVSPGQALARLDPTDLVLAARAADSRATAAQNSFNEASANLRRFTTLREKNFISEAELERHRNTLATARAALDSAKSEASLARHQQDYATLTSDAEGVITAIDAEAGQVVGAGQSVMRLARAGQGEIAIFVPEDQRALLAGHRGITVSLWALPGKRFAARVREVSPSADPLTRTFAVRLELTEPAPLQLGMSASVTITRPLADARIRLPTSALIASGTAAAVWVVDPQSSAVRRQAVVIGAADNNQVLIESGLAPGQVVVTAGATYLHDQQPVRAMASAP